MARVGLIGDNSVGYINSLIEIWNSGDCAVLVDWRTPVDVAVNLLREAKAEKCYIESSMFHKYKYVFSGKIGLSSFDKQNEFAAILPPNVREKYNRSYSCTEAIILYSSGTTGKAKGVILSHFAISTNADAIINYMRPTSTDCLYIAKSLSHASAVTGELLVALMSGANILIAPTIVPPRYILKNIDVFGVTILCLNPSLLKLCVSEYRGQYGVDSTLKEIYVSGSYISEQLITDARRIFDKQSIYNVYGLSEAGPRVSAQRKDCCKINSVGKPIQNVRVIIVDENGATVSNGMRGMIHVQSPSLYSGYVNNADRVGPSLSGWLNTGDIGYYDADGELFVLGRKDDLVSIHSHKVYLHDVELKILEHSAISECCVVKLCSKYDEFLGCLYVGDFHNDLELKKELQLVLMPYEIPRLFLRVDKLPYNLNGKIDTRLVAQILVKALENNYLKLEIWQ